MNGLLFQRRLESSAPLHEPTSENTPLPIPLPASSSAKATEDWGRGEGRRDAGGSPMNWPLVYHSLLVSGAATAAALAGGFCAALFLAGLPGAWRKLFTLAAIVALVSPPFLVVNCWIELLGERGAWRPWLPWNIYSYGGAIWVLLLLTWPIPFFLVSAALGRARAADLEIDPLLRGWALLRWLLLPLSRAALWQGAILTMVLTLNNFAVPAILQVKVFPAEIWVRFNTTFNYASALELSWPLILAPLLLVLCFRGRDAAWSWRSDAAAAGAVRRQLGGAWHGAAGAVAALFWRFFPWACRCGNCGQRQNVARIWPRLFWRAKLRRRHSVEYAAARRLAW